jgi:putative ATP-dependent endonuclease of OLD family
MQLVQFSATNYRSITSAHRIKFQGVTVLIGRNNEGKSNLLRALEVAMNLLIQHAPRSRGLNRQFHRVDAAYVWERDFPIQLQNRRTSLHTILKLDFQLDDNECSQFKAEIGSNINGSLGLEIKIGRDQKPQIRYVKRGKNTTALAAKSAKIAQFVADRIHFNYIPAVRTDDTAIKLIRGLIDRELQTLETEPQYQAALKTIDELQQPILTDLGGRVREPLQEFLPSIKHVALEISKSRHSFLRDVRVMIDDGTPTLLEHKGDGVQSLAALALLKSRTAPTGASILAIEEPESHLHPGAIHQVNEIIQSISQTSQVIVTTHNPLFVDRENIKANVIVTNGGATPAKNIAAIREILGIKASDNLTHANYALVVEGEKDVIALRALLPLLSDKVGKALKNNMLVIEPIGGAGNLSYKLSLLRNSLCAVYTLLDNDEAGRKAHEKAKKDSLTSDANCTFIICAGMQDAEFEDCLNLEIYKDAIFDELGVDLSSKKFGGNGKWSDRLRTTFLYQGKQFNPDVLKEAKGLVAFATAKNARDALNKHKRNSIDALVVGLEKMIRG